MMLRVALNLLLLVAGGCATSFYGSAHVEGDRPGCERKCEEVGLQMQAFVFMGEYSTACVCDAPGHATHAGGSASPAVSAAVMTQMRDAQNDVSCEGANCSRF